MDTTTTRWTPVMHAVLDGEATDDERAALEAHLAADPAARREFGQLEALFARLAAVTPLHPPEGMVAAIETRLDAVDSDDFSTRGQLPGRARVLDSTARHSDAGAESKSSYSRFYFGKNAMSESTSLFANRKALVGGGIAIAAAAIALTFGLGSAPKPTDVAGTIVPAERYRAPQVATQDIPLGDQSVSQLLQNDAFLKLIKDPQVQSLVLEPDFAASSQLMLDSPEAARNALAGTPDAQTSAAARVLLAHPEAARLMLANPEANRAILRNPEASRSFVPNADRNVAAGRNTVLQSPDANLLTPGKAPDANLTNVDRAPDANLLTPGKTPDANLTNVNRAPDANRLTYGKAPDANLTNVNRAPDANRLTYGKAPDANLTNVNRAPDANRLTYGKAPDANLTNVNRAPDANRLTYGKAPDANRTTVNQAPDAARNNANN